MRSHASHDRAFLTCLDFRGGVVGLDQDLFALAVAFLSQTERLIAFEAMVLVTFGGGSLGSSPSDVVSPASPESAKAAAVGSCGCSCSLASSSSDMIMRPVCLSVFSVFKVYNKINVHQPCAWYLRDIGQARTSLEQASEKATTWALNKKAAIKPNNLPSASPGVSAPAHEELNAMRHTSNHSNYVKGRKSKTNPSLALQD